MTTDPFAHGTPVGDSHTWVSAGSLPCPNCPCCSTRLCQVAREQGTSCAAIGRDSDYDLTRCPCSGGGR